MLKIMIDEDVAPTTRMKVAVRVRAHARDGLEIEAFSLQVKALERAAKAPGHGAKIGRKKEQAIAALLAQRSVADAARVVGIATQTLTIHGLLHIRLPCDGCCQMSVARICRVTSSMSNRSRCAP